MPKALELRAFLLYPVDFRERRDWAAVHAVCSEPVSESNSLINREFAGNFVASGARLERVAPIKSSALSAYWYFFRVEEQGIYFS